MIPQSFIQDLLHRVDIVDVVERHVKLKRAGANYVACCPFHAEKTPSFTVSQTKQFYHCFGCGAHGTAVGFLMEFSSLGFVDAVKDLAQSVGMTVPQEERSERSQQRAAESQPTNRCRPCPSADRAENSTSTNHRVTLRTAARSRMRKRKGRWSDRRQA